MKIKLINKDSYLFTILFNRLYKLQVESFPNDYMLAAKIFVIFAPPLAAQTFFPSDKPHESVDKSHEGMIKRSRASIWKIACDLKLNKVSHVIPGDPWWPRGLVKSLFKSWGPGGGRSE